MGEVWTIIYTVNNKSNNTYEALKRHCTQIQMTFHLCGLKVK